MNRIPLLIFVFLASCDSLSVSVAKNKESLEDQISICAIVANASKYDGRDLLISGIYSWEPDGAILLGKSCSVPEISLKLAKEYKKNNQASSMLEHLMRDGGPQKAQVVLRGTFRASRVGQCFNVHCAEYQVEVTELVTAKPER